MTVLISVDPSIKDFGWAVFLVDDKRKVCGYSDSGFIRFSSKVSWEERIDESVDSIGEATKGWGKGSGGSGGLLGAIEHPEPYASARGEAAKNTGATLKLMAQAWSIRAAMRANGGRVTMTTPTGWKGQTNKDHTARRMLRAWGLNFDNHNECDAVGIGTWYIREILGYRLTGR